MHRQILLMLLCCLFVPVCAQQYKANWEQVEKFGNMVRNFRNDLSI